MSLDDLVVPCCEMLEEGFGAWVNYSEEPTADSLRKFIAKELQEGLRPGVTAVIQECEVYWFEKSAYVQVKIYFERVLKIDMTWLWKDLENDVTKSDSYVKSSIE